MVDLDYVLLWGRGYKYAQRRLLSQYLLTSEHFLRFGSSVMKLYSHLEFDSTAPQRAVTICVINVKL